MRQLHVDNHYVPRMYLRRWAVAEKVSTHNLLVSDSRVPQWKRHSIGGIAFHQHLYTQIVGGDETDELERWLDREFESPAEIPIDRAISGQSLTRDDWRALIRFAFCQDVRTPARLRYFLRRQAQELPMQLEKIMQRAVSDLSQDKFTVRPGETRNTSRFPLKLTMKDRLNGSGELKAEAVVGRSLWHWALRHLLTTTVEKISYQGWSVLRASPGCSWPTSDSPLIRLNYANRWSYDFCGGWKVPNGDILMPLSPTHLLHYCHGRKSFSKDHVLNTDVSEYIRRLVVEHADRYVFTKSEFDVHAYRDRVVDAELFAVERDTWKNWPGEQAQVERALESGAKNKDNGVRQSFGS